jgi:FkbM family methyltransferase
MACSLLSHNKETVMVALHPESVRSKSSDCAGEMSSSVTDARAAGLLEHRNIPWARRLRHRLGKVIGDHAPGALHFMADAQARKGTRIQRRGEVIDIVQGDRIVRIARANAVYAPSVSESFDYFFSSVEPVCARVDGATVLLTDFSTPRLHRMIGFDDFPVLCPSLTEPFVTTQQYLDFVQLQPGQVVIDLGAYSGLTSIVFAQAVGPTGRVIAVEPDPLTLAACKVNFAAANLPQLSLVEAAVTTSAGVIQLSSEGALGSAFASLVGTHRGKVVEVEAITLDGLMRRCQLDQIDFIKMDIEGAEASVLPGSVEFLQRYRPKLIIEPHTIDGISTAPAIRTLLESIGYRCELIDQHGLVTWPLLAATP